jgi:hypothetical protein
MRETLVDLVEKSGSRIISVVGLAKNTGKTTTLIYLVGRLGAEPGVLALTSTGRDGEAIDEITRREKPSVTVEKGTLATVSQRSLNQGPGLSVVHETPYATATGGIVIVRAEQTTRVVLEGPATAAEMGRLVTDLIEQDGARYVIIDGSLDRVAAAAPGVSDGVILTAGAILGPDMETAVRKTRHAVDLFATGESPVAVPGDNGVSRFCAASADGRDWELREGSAITDLSPVMGMVEEGARYLYISGALTDEVLEAFMERGLFPVVIAQDATRLFASGRSLARYAAGGGAVRVRRRIRLIALTVNPHNPEGIDFDPDGFLVAMRAVIPDVPVFDIVREEARGIQARP